MSTVATSAKPPATSQKPLVKRQFGKISVAIFGREVRRPDGTTFISKDYVLQKSYKDGQGNWQDQSIRLRPHDILAVQQALTQAFIDSYDKNDDEE
jgi:hypothetical protein